MCCSSLRRGCVSVLVSFLALTIAGLKLIINAFDPTFVSSSPNPSGSGLASSFLSCSQPNLDGQLVSSPEERQSSSPSHPKSAAADKKAFIPPPFPGLRQSPRREAIWHVELEDEQPLPAIGEGGWDIILDARSPGEFREDHVPGSTSTPVLDNTERAEVGTTYKKDRFLARRIGAALISESIAKHLRSPVLSHLKPNAKILVICWRGGERSHSLATILARVGFRVGVLKGGYQGYRRRVVRQLSKLGRLKYVVICGPTGSGKTNFLKSLKERGAQVIDLEGVANHKGSILGDNLKTPQPTQKIFEGLMALEAGNIDPDKPVFIEDEGSRVGSLHLPSELWRAKKLAPRCNLSVPIDFRVKCIRDDYKYFEDSKNLQPLCDRLRGLHKRVGKKSVERYIKLAEEGSWDELVKDLLVTHYDSAYAKAVERSTPDDAKGNEGAIVHDVTLKSEDDYSRKALEVIERFQSHKFSIHVRPTSPPKIGKKKKKNKKGSEINNSGNSDESKKSR